MEELLQTMRRPRIPLHAAVLLASSITVSASAIRAESLFALEDTAKCFPNFKSCPQTDLPPNFCCPSGSTCIALAGNTTLLCCPEGVDCKTVSPIGCQLELQDANKHPDAILKTTALNGVLGHCGDGTCCPFGYSCRDGADGKQNCYKDANQNAVPFQTVPGTPSSAPASSPSSIPSTSSASATSITSTTPTTTQSTTEVVPTPSPTSTFTPGDNNGASSGADTTPTDTAQQPSSNSGTPTAVIAGAAVGAVLLAAACAFIALVFLRRRRSSKERRAETSEGALKLTRSTSSFGNIISNPIGVSENATMRSDFVRKSPGAGAGLARSSVGSGFSGKTRADSEELFMDPPGAGTGYQKTTPSPARMRDGVGTVGGTAPRIPPIRGMAAARQSSIAYGFGAPDTSPYAAAADGNYHAAGGRAPPETPKQQREPSGISINVFADPRIATPQSNHLRVGGEHPDARRDSHMTTFSDMLRSADLGGVAEGKPFVPPGSEKGTPASRRK